MTTPALDDLARCARATDRDLPPEDLQWLSDCIDRIDFTIPVHPADHALLADRELDDNADDAIA
jgi:hypothetical protein